jgi:hypothetical protein
MRAIILSCGVLLFLGCNTSPSCDSIKVGDTIEEDTTQCFSSRYYGGLPLTGTCSDTGGVWTCAAASRAHNAYAAGCASSAAYHCMVELDEAGKVVCVKNFCQD